MNLVRCPISGQGGEAIDERRCSEIVKPREHRRDVVDHQHQPRCITGRQTSGPTSAFLERARQELHGAVDPVELTACHVRAGRWRAGQSGEASGVAIDQVQVHWF